MLIIARTPNSYAVLKIAILLLGLVFPVGAQAQVYKYVDENGIVTYTNTKPGGYPFQTLNFPCYAADPKCRQVDWTKVPLDRERYVVITRAVAETYAVDEALVRAIIHAESAFQADAVSPKGAMGLMQLIPANQSRYGISDPFEPEQNIPGGVAHLAELLDQFDHNTELVLAAYNAGAGAVKKFSGVPPYEETREYVRRVKILYRRYKQKGS